MKPKFERIMRAGIFALLMLLAWSVWSAAVEGTNASAAPGSAGASTNGLASQLQQRLSQPNWINRLAEDYPFLTKKWMGNEIWKYILSLVYIFLAFYVSKLLDFLTRVWLKRWAEKTKTQFDELALGLLNGPLKIIAFLILLRIGLEVFTWPPVIQMALGKIITIIVAAAVTYTLLKFVDLALGYWRRRSHGESDRALDEQLFPIIRKSLKVFVVVVAALVTLDNLGVNITAAIASLSIGGLAVGLAAQDTLANLFGAVAVFADKPFRVGDVIQMDNVTGTVESIGLRSTRVRNFDGHLVTIPNKAVGNATIANLSRRTNIKTEMNLGLVHETSPDQMRRALKILEEIYRGNPNTFDLIVTFNKFTDSSLNILVLHWWKGMDFAACRNGLQEANLAIMKRFEAENIRFAFPARMIYMKQEPQAERPRSPGKGE